MKKYLTIIIAIFFATVLHAQKIRYGVEAGINTGYLNLKGDDGIENNSTGWQGGFTALIPVEKQLALQPKMLLVQRNTRVSYARLDLKFLEVPVCLVYSKDGFTAGAGAGLVYGISAKARYKYEDESSIYSLYEPNESEMPLRRAGITANVTMGYIFPNGIAVNAHFSPVLNDLQKDGYVEGIYSKTIGFSVGYYFR